MAEDKIVVPADKPEISKKVKVDLEVDTSVKDLGPKSLTDVSTSNSTATFLVTSFLSDGTTIFSSAIFTSLSSLFFFFFYVID